MEYENIFHNLIETSFDAGKVILDIYRQDFSVDMKDDKSPVTEADKKAEDIILASLNKLAPNVPVIAEEAVSAGKVPEIGSQFFLVDPLDGTKEFINKRDEFTVNIALVDNGVPRFGIVYAPAMKRIFYTHTESEAFSAELDADSELCELQNNHRIETRSPSSEGFVVVASRSHMTDATKAFLEDYKTLSIKSAGSSLKFCLIAAGEADLYPRHGPTMEWDTAAGHAVLRAAGGVVVREDQTPLLYGKTDDGYLNPYFIAWGKQP